MSIDTDQAIAEAREILREGFPGIGDSDLEVLLAALVARDVGVR